MLKLILITFVFLMCMWERSTVALSGKKNLKDYFIWANGKPIHGTVRWQTSTSWYTIN